MNLYDAVKASANVPEAAERYGLDVGRTGMARCIFHDDRHPSMKLNEDYFFCFGCGAHGDMIDLTARLFGLSSYEAARRLSVDFGLDENTMPRRETLWDVVRRLRRWKAEFAPRSPDDEPDERYVEACKKLDYVEYLLEEERYGKKSKVA